MGKPPVFSGNLLKSDNFFDFLFASMNDKVLLRGFCPKVMFFLLEVGRGRWGDVSHKSCNDKGGIKQMIVSICISLKVCLQTLNISNHKSCE